MVQPPLQKMTVQLLQACFIAYRRWKSVFIFIAVVLTQEPPPLKNPSNGFPVLRSAASYAQRLEFSNFEADFNRFTVINRTVILQYYTMKSALTLSPVCTEENTPLAPAAREAPPNRHFLFSIPRHNETMTPEKYKKLYTDCTSWTCLWYCYIYR